ncbi:hypothetical protein SYNTR_0654 [Candidatus Syntrophocurvum alkaliphilum]|uniref:Glycoside hydrolase family 57 N-terminal domain-containing protein n=1 Tax=Candidatus Syntrophocurvum alkaliphilum TaxID=2293317 RepID=A0A6I6DA10_9FIRM|nr:hypothetical protein [Candidatus Syntrophocurvum alkaliphilum]QGT99247.1 hypothetical protein SYNTR_0654 [Candidatus Syntrophocurvum alkaliphilum]
MKGYIALCPHFHQPHFQLYKTREEAFKNSYIPWIELLNEAVKLKEFYINLHFSGPFLYWIKDQKPEYVKQLQEIISSGKIGILGGLADEPFIQLSSRIDDYLYQIKKYDELCSEITGKKSYEWEGIHLVERECGELILKEVTRVARYLKTLPLYYLDAETFYESYFSYSGGSRDYCFKHFGFTDPFSNTTISHFPQQLLYYCFRDEIGGEEFFSIPVHSQFRYKLLKRQTFSDNDNVRVKPEHYYFYIKDALEKAYEHSIKLGVDKAPILLIFEDAEKLGQWSKDPKGDKKWLLQFFKLIEADEELEFCGLRKYYEKFGYLDTYPVRSSFSYPEWENWTAKRGIRGVCFGDERLRRVICRLRNIEEKQKEYEDKIINYYLKNFCNIDSIDLQSIVEHSLIDSLEKHKLVSSILEKHYSIELKKIYETINRVRNLIYQEDPKWASRHPSYGSSPYYDVFGLAYLEIADRLLIKAFEKLNKNNEKETYIQVIDWNKDGNDNIIIENPNQTAVVSTRGGCISYLHALSPKISNNKNKMLSLLKNDFAQIKAYNSILQYSTPLILTENDSELTIKYYHEGGRLEQSRNAFRCKVLLKINDEYKTIENFNNYIFNIEKIETNENCTLIKLKCVKEVQLTEFETINIELIKEFKFFLNSLSVNISVVTDKKNINQGKLYLVPELVTSATPSDEVEFQPEALIGLVINDDNSLINYKIENITTMTEKGSEYININETNSFPIQVDYLYKINSADRSEFYNRVSFAISSEQNINKLDIKPAVKQYYKDYIFKEQSELEYHTSGIMLKPYVPFKGESCNFKVDMSWDFNLNNNINYYQKKYNLINFK